MLCRGLDYVIRNGPCRLLLLGDPSGAAIKVATGQGWIAVAVANEYGVMGIRCRNPTLPPQPKNVLLHI